MPFPTSDVLLREFLHLRLLQSINAFVAFVTMRYTNSRLTLTLTKAHDHVQGPKPQCTVLHCQFRIPRFRFRSWTTGCMQLKAATIMVCGLSYKVYLGKLKIYNVVNDQNSSSRDHNTLVQKVRTVSKIIHRVGCWTWNYYLLYVWI